MPKRWPSLAEWYKETVDRCTYRLELAFFSPIESTTHCSSAGNEWIPCPSPRHPPRWEPCILTSLPHTLPYTSHTLAEAGRTQSREHEFCAFRPEHHVTTSPCHGRSRCLSRGYLPAQVLEEGLHSSPLQRLHGRRSSLLQNIGILIDRLLVLDSPTSQGPSPGGRLSEVGASG